MEKTVEKKDKLVAVYFDIATSEKLVELSKLKTKQLGFKHSLSDIVRLAVNDLLRQNGLV